VDVNKSPLQQIQFAVVDSKISIIAPPESSSETVYDFDIELDIYQRVETESIIRIFYTITAKHCAPDIAGLSIEVQAASDFSIDDSIEPKSETFSNLVNFSATAIAYNNVRAYLQNITTYYPVEPYILPAIDLNDLCSKYRQKMEKKRSEIE